MIVAVAHLAKPGFWQVMEVARGPILGSRMLGGSPKGRRTSMTIDAKTTALLGAIERRLTDISEQQHALAVEKARLLEQLTPLRMGILAPDTAVVQLKAKGSGSED
jgi:hypothetical protein